MVALLAYKSYSVVNGDVSKHPDLHSTKKASQEAWYK